MGDQADNDAEDDEKKWIHKSTYDVQRSKLEKLMSNPLKPVFIPQPRKEKDVNKAADFQYNVMGSSAGAGSGEFHVYRQIRRKEMFRTRILDKEREKEELDDAFQVKMAEAKKAEDEKSEKKRKKRNKKKEAAKRRREEAKKNKKGKKVDDKETDEESDDDSDDSDKEEE